MTLNLKPFTVITCTGDRHEALKLCKHYLQRSTIQPFQWLVVDDGEMPFNPGDCDYKRREPTPLKQPVDGCVSNSISENLAHALKHVSFDKVIAMEDDDWYDPTYLETMYNLLDHADLVGEGLNWVYNIQTRKYKRHINNKHASFCSSGFSRKVVPLMQDICTRGRTYLDLSLWEECLHTKHLILKDDHLTVGMKGLPGRLGVTNGHKVSDKLFRLCEEDTDFDFLRRLIGDDWELYAGLRLKYREQYKERERLALLEEERRARNRDLAQ